MARRPGRQKGPLLGNDPLVWLIGTALDLFEEGVRRLLEAVLNALPKLRSKARRRK